MSVIPIGGGTPLSRPSPARMSGGTGFLVPESAASSASSGVRAQAMVGANALSAMLGMQEIDPPQERDRRARRQGEKLLAALQRLQLAVLSGENSDAITGELASLTTETATAADPNLRAVIDGITLRCAVEMERHGRALQRNIRT
ncbi:MAG: flagellar assembly protein FliX [Acetobacteraceae bacterium]|nr:flagellar assembly protein FliX [Acetobacteraceae bacterium]